MEEESPAPEEEWSNSMLLQLALEHKAKHDHAISVEKPPSSHHHFDPREKRC